MDAEPTKTCKKCGQTKPPSDFRPDKSEKDGRCARCKACRNEAHGKWREANPEKARESGRESGRKYRAANPEKVRAANRKYRAANPEKVREKDRKYRAANPEKGREACRKYENNVKATRRFFNVLAAIDAIKQTAAEIQAGCNTCKSGHDCNFPEHEHGEPCSGYVRKDA